MSSGAAMSPTSFSRALITSFTFQLASERHQPAGGVKQRCNKGCNEANLLASGGSRACACRMPATTASALPLSPAKSAASSDASKACAMRARSQWATHQSRAG